MIVSGKSPTQIAEILSINVKTVGTYKRRLMEKMKVDSTAELVRYAVDNHLTEQLPL
jgi:DNA-binding CsgD family transcriptional regulator